MGILKECLKSPLSPSTIMQTYNIAWCNFCSLLFSIVKWRKEVETQNCPNTDFPIIFVTDCSLFSMISERRNWDKVPLYTALVELFYNWKFGGTLLQVSESVATKINFFHISLPLSRPKCCLAWQKLTKVTVFYTLLNIEK